MRAEFSKPQRWRDSFQQGNYINMFDATARLWVILGPDSHVLIQMMRAKDWPITSQIVEIVHDHSNKQINDLENKRKRIFRQTMNWKSDNTKYEAFLPRRSRWNKTRQNRSMRSPTRKDPRDPLDLHSGRIWRLLDSYRTALSAASFLPLPT